MASEEKLMKRACRLVKLSRYPVDVSQLFHADMKRRKLGRLVRLLDPLKVAMIAD